MLGILHLGAVVLLLLPPEQAVLLSEATLVMGQQLAWYQEPVTLQSAVV